MSTTDYITKLQDVETNLVLSDVARISNQTGPQLLKILQQLSVNVSNITKLTPPVLSSLIWCRNLSELPQDANDSILVDWIPNDADKLLDWSKLSYHFRTDNIMVDIYNSFNIQHNDPASMAVVLSNLSHWPIRVSNSVYMQLRNYSLDDLYNSVTILLINTDYSRYIPFYHREDLIFILSTGYIMDKQAIVDGDRWKMLSQLSPTLQQTIINLYSNVDGYKNKLAGIAHITNILPQESIVLSSQSTEDKVRKLGLTSSPRQGGQIPDLDQTLINNISLSPRINVNVINITKDRLSQLSSNQRSVELGKISNEQISQIMGIEIPYSNRLDLIMKVRNGFTEETIFWVDNDINCNSMLLPTPANYTSTYIGIGTFTDYRCYPTIPLLQHFAAGYTTMPGSPGMNFSSEQITYIVENSKKEERQTSKHTSSSSSSVSEVISKPTVVLGMNDNNLIPIWNNIFRYAFLAVGWDGVGHSYMQSENDINKPSIKTNMGIMLETIKSQIRSLNTQTRGQLLSSKARDGDIDALYNIENILIIPREPYTKWKVYYDTAVYYLNKYFQQTPPKIE